MKTIFSFIIIFGLVFVYSCNESSMPSDPVSAMDNNTLAKPLKIKNSKPPLYGASWLNTADGYGVFYFYLQDISVIPLTHNFRLPAMNAPSLPMTVKTDILLKDPSDFIPKIVHTTNTDDVLCWFFTQEDGDAITADWQIYMSELVKKKLMAGYATTFNSVAHNNIGPGALFNVSAKGYLEDGRSFHFNFEEQYTSDTDYKLRGNIIIK